MRKSASQTPQRIHTFSILNGCQPAAEYLAEPQLVFRLIAEESRVESSRVKTTLSMPSDSQLACTACTKAKRKCTKQIPTCARCLEKGVDCTYPVPKVLVPLDALLDGDGGGRLSAALSSLHTGQTSASASASRHIAVPLSTGTNTVSVSVSVSPSARMPEQLRNPWFLDRSQWNLDYSPSSASSLAYVDSGLHNFIAKLKSWLRQWTETGSCAFIHARLYADELPEYLQYAYAACQTYQTAKSPQAKTTALQIARAWSKKLVQEQAIHERLNGPGPGGDGGNIQIPVWESLCRTQALLVFQIIQLFDGDVRARAEAEASAVMLKSWAEELMQSAAEEVETLAASRHRYEPSDPDSPLGHGLDPLPGWRELRTSGTLTSTWYAWAYSESIRRTCLTAVLADGAFAILRQGWSLCPGSIIFSATAGMWEADSPSAWLATVRKGNPATYPFSCRAAHRLLTMAKAREVDDFTQALIAFGSGLETIQDWRAEDEEG